MDSHWMSEGLCRNYPPAKFFPSDGVGVDVARKICATCPVKSPCLEYALIERIDHGVWGGCSERERRRILKRRRVAAAAVHCPPGAPGGDPLRQSAVGRLLRRLVGVLGVQALLELPLTLAERAGQLRQLRATEDH